MPEKIYIRRGMKCETMAIIEEALEELKQMKAATLIHIAIVERLLAKN